MNDVMRLAARTLIVGCEGSTLAAHEESLLREYEFAGLVVFARNLNSLREGRGFTDAVRGAYAQRLDPILAIDHEGGRVLRLHEGIAPIPAAMAIGATRDLELAAHAGEQSATDVRRIGCNVLFAPVCDVAAEPRNTVIGTRAFSGDPDVVTALASAFGDGAVRGGALPVFKHFPGHGATVADSHLGIAHVTSSAHLWRTRDLAPFAAVARDARAMMTAHVIVDAVDPDVPATISHRLLTDVLRVELGFEGVLFTDCLTMGAIAASIGSVEAGWRAIAAGADCIMVSHDLTLAAACVDRLVAAVESGELSRERLREASERVDALRARLTPPLPLDTAGPYPGVAGEIAAAAVTLVRGAPSANANRCVAVSFRGALGDGIRDLRDTAALDASWRNVRELALPLDPALDAVDAACASIASQARRPIVLLRRAHVHDLQADAARRIVERFPDAMIVSTAEPYEVACVPQARTVLCTYDDGPAALHALADVLFEGRPVRGALPVTLAHV